MATRLDWRQRRRLKGRIKEIHRGLETCALDPGRLPEVSQRLGVPAATLREWLELPAPWPGSGAERRLELRELPASPPFEVVKGGASGQRWVIRQASSALPHAEEVRRMIVLLLDLPLAREAPDWAGDFVAHLVEAALRRDDELLDGLSAALFDAQHSWLQETWAQRELPIEVLAGREPTSTLGQLTAEVGRAVTEAASAGDRSLESELQRATVLPAPSARPASTSLPPAPAPAGEWQAVRALLATLGGDPEARESLDKVLAFFDSLVALAGGRPEPLQGEVDLLVVVRHLLERVVADLAGRSGLAREGVEQVLRRLRRAASAPVPSLRWLLEQGASRGGGRRAGDALPPGADVAWTLLQRLAELEPPSPPGGPGPRLESRDSRRRYLEELVTEGDPWRSLEAQRAEPVVPVDRILEADRYLELGESVELSFEPANKAYREAVVFRRMVGLVRQVESVLLEPAELFTRPVHTLLSRIRLAPRGQEPEPRRMTTGEEVTLRLPVEAEEDRRRQRDWLWELRHLLTTPSLAADPELAVQVAGRVCRNRGTLSWQACLTLANSRARCHRYLDGDGAASWQVMADVRPGADGGLEVPYAVVEQPLSSRFRQRFEAEGLPGRVEILYRLVRYAARPRGSRLAIAEVDARHQVSRRDEELWQTLDEVTA